SCGTGAALGAGVGDDVAVTVSGAAVVWFEADVTCDAMRTSGTRLSSASARTTLLAATDDAPSTPMSCAATSTTQIALDPNTNERRGRSRRARRNGSSTSFQLAAATTAERPTNDHRSS